MDENKRVMALFNESTIRVYQAYNDRIADEAVRLGTFGPCFKMDRMTWIKPSFLWMMYRSGWATKEGQKRILAIDIQQTGFDTILKNAILSEFDKSLYSSYENWQSKLQSSEVRCQWDPDKDIYCKSLNRRAIQLGLRGSMVLKYVNEWIIKITDITSHVVELRELIRLGDTQEIVLPIEREYPVDNTLKKILGIHE